MFSAFPRILAAVVALAVGIGAATCPCGMTPGKRCDAVKVVAPAPSCSHCPQPATRESKPVPPCPKCAAQQAQVKVAEQASHVDLKLAPLAIAPIDGLVELATPTLAVRVESGQPPPAILLDLFHSACLLTL